MPLRVAALESDWEMYSVTLSTIDLSRQMSLLHSKKNLNSPSDASTLCRLNGLTFEANGQGLSPGRVNFDFTDLEDDPPPPARTATATGRGKPPSPVLDSLVIPCHSIKNPETRRFRCVGQGCQESWASPRMAGRILPHFADCRYLTAELRDAALVASAGSSLGARVLDTASGDMFAKFKKVGAENKADAAKARVDKTNYLAMNFLCDAGVAPTVVDNLSFLAFIEHLSPTAHGLKVGTTFSTNYIPAEAHRVTELAIEELKTEYNLSLGFDGGDEASGFSHTGEHIKGLILGVMDKIGRTNFASLNSDNTGNTRLGRELAQAEVITLLIVPDPNHHLANAIKNVCSIEYFVDAKCGKATAQIHHVDSFTVAVVPHVVLAFPHWEPSDQTLSASSTTASTKSRRKIAKKMSLVVTVGRIRTVEKIYLPAVGSTSMAKLLRHRHECRKTSSVVTLDVRRGQRSRKSRLPRRRTRRGQPHTSRLHELAMHAGRLDAAFRDLHWGKAAAAAGMAQRPSGFAQQLHMHMPLATDSSMIAPRPKRGTEHTATGPPRTRPARTWERQGREGERKWERGATMVLPDRMCTATSISHIFRRPRGAESEVAVTERFELVVGQQTMLHKLSRDAMPDFAVGYDSTRKNRIPNE
ncbi:hypothetical protein C8R47DRAFT_1202511 [Mycena vitilis]|nr:hypothetical protein C8R47DRAFT_1202511 [Mycena vitilis]